MEKAVKLFTTALALWLSAASLANSAGLLEEQSKYNRAKQIAAARTTKPSASPAKARTDALLGFKYEHGLGVPQSFEVAAEFFLGSGDQGSPSARADSVPISANSRRRCFQADAGPNLHGP